MKLSLKWKTLIAVALFIVVFVALLLVATFCDFQVSQLLTKNALKEGEYFATDFFGVLLECVGCIPLYLMIAFGLCVLFWSSVRIVREKNNALGIVLAVLCGIGVVVACWYTVKDITSYVFEHIAATVSGSIGHTAMAGGDVYKALEDLKHSGAIYGIEVIIGILIAAPSILVTKLFDRDTLVKLLRFLLATAVALVVANVLVMIVKNPVGRMRFRAINSTLGATFIETKDVPGFTRWYVLNKQPSDTVLEAFKNFYGVSDAFKSFPSGHTCSAGTVYALIMIPDLFELKGKKGAKLACWIVPIVYTALVAISRIVVGAHYMSDVLFGGTFAFVCIAIAREIFLYRGAHVLSVFGKEPKKAPVLAGAYGTAIAEPAPEETEQATASEETPASDETPEEQTETYVQSEDATVENGDDSAVETEESKTE